MKFTVTIKDVLDDIKFMDFRIELCGINMKDFRSIRKFRKEVADAFFEEQGIDKNNLGQKIPNVDAELGRKSLMKFLKFQLWILKKEEAMENKNLGGENETRISS